MRRKELAAMARCAAGMVMLVALSSSRADTLGANEQAIHDAARMGTDVEVMAIFKRSRR